MRREQWNRREDGRKQRSEKYSERTLVLRVVIAKPADIQNKGSSSAPPQQAPPGLDDGHRQDGQVQQHDVGEQHHLVVLSSGEQHRSCEAAGQRKGGQ